MVGAKVGGGWIFFLNKPSHTNTVVSHQKSPKGGNFERGNGSKRMRQNEFKTFGDLVIYKSSPGFLLRKKSLPTSAVCFDRKHFGKFMFRPLKSLLVLFLLDWMWKNMGRLKWFCYSIIWDDDLVVFSAVSQADHPVRLGEAAVTMDISQAFSWTKRWQNVFHYWDGQ